jgi:hypothetical protein
MLTRVHRTFTAAHDACQATQARLKDLDLDADEFESVNSARGLDILMKKIQQTTEAREQASQKHPIMKKAGHFVEVFSEFVTRTSVIIELLLPQSPEYRTTYGVLLLVFKTVFKRKETQESLLAYIQKLSVRLPIVDFYAELFPSYRAKKIVVSIYVEILNLLNEAIVYYRSNHLRQLRDAVLRPVETKFDKCIHRIEAEIDKLHELKDAAHIAEQSDTKEIVESLGLVVGRIHENLNHSMAEFGSRLALLDDRTEKIEQQTSSMYNFQAFNHCLALIEVLLPTASTADEQLSLVREHHFDLSPKDHWYENGGVLKVLEDWSAYGRVELLWIGGRTGNRDTWITEMSIDLIDALQMQDLTLLHTFCDIAEEPITVTTLIKQLIAQLLDRHPDIPFRQPKKYNIRRFQRATTFKRCWAIFEALVSELKSSVFIVIDRIDDCDVDSGSDGGGYADLSHDLMPYLMGLASEAEHVSIIVTSTEEPPETLVGEEELRHFYRDTRKSRGKRDG